MEPISQTIAHTMSTDIVARHLTLIHEMANVANSSWPITDEAGHAIEVGIMTGQIRQAMFLHHRDNQGITAQQSDLLSDGGCRGNEVRGDRQDLDAEIRNLVDNLAKSGQLPNIIGMTQHVPSDARSRPAKPVDGLQSHGAMGNIGQHVRRGIPDQFLFCASFQELLTREVQDWMWREMVNEYVRVQEHSCTARNVGQRHGHSSVPNSGSRAIRSTVSASPFQPTNPAVELTRLTPVWTVICTFWCSFSGSGSAGLSTPFS